MFPESFMIQETQPVETQLERYMMTNEMGQTFYVYCKVLYEEITEEFLYKNYDIKKAPTKKESYDEESESFTGKSDEKNFRKMSNSSEEEFPDVRSKNTPKIRKLAKNSITNEGSVLDSPLSRRPKLRREESFTSSHKPKKHNDNKKSINPSNDIRRSSLMMSFDEMDIPGTVYRKFTTKARKKSGGSDPKNQDAVIPGIAPNSTKNYYVPLALCIKTKCPANDFTEQLLLNLINLLYTDPNTYRTDTQNLIYSYSELLSHIMQLSHITCPPPLTQYSISLGQSEISYAEGPISELPTDSDISVAQLFSQVDCDLVITLWTAFLLDIRVIIYTNSINEYFFIMKGLDQLMFPLRWHNSKGIAPMASLLLQPPACCYGLLKSIFPNKYEIINCLKEEKYPHVLFDVDVPSIHIFPEDDFMIYPRENELRQELSKLCNRYGIVKSGFIKNIQDRHIEFSKQVRQLFMSEIMPYVKDVDFVIKRTKTSDYYEFADAYVKFFSEQNPKPKKPQIMFLKRIADSLCFSVLFHEIYDENQFEFTRFQTMLAHKPKIGFPEKNQLNFNRILLSSPQSVVISRISRVADKVRSNAKREESVNQNDGILPKVKVQWIDEIAKMKNIQQRQMQDDQQKILYNSGNSSGKRTTFGVKKYSGVAFSTSSDGSGGNRTIIQEVSKENFIIDMKIEEQKQYRLNPAAIPSASICPGMNTQSMYFPMPVKGHSMSPSNKALIFRKKPRKGPFFYGPMGILSFCQELFTMGNTHIKNTLNLFEEVKSLIEKTKGSSTKVNSASSGNDIQTDSQILNIKSRDDAYYMESSISGVPQIHITSPLLEALIEPKELLRKSTLLNPANEPFLTFSTTNSCQFYMFCAIYYSKYQQHPYEIVKVFFSIG